MEHPSLNFVLRNPDGSICLLSQPHLADKRHTQCPNCPCSVVYTKGQKSTQCPSCQKKIKIPKEKARSIWECSDCLGEAKVYGVAGLKFQRCTGCGKMDVVID